MNKFSVNIVDILTVSIFLVYSLTLGIDARKIVGGGVVILGIIFWLTARYQLGKAFSITPKANFIVKHGIYKKIRHPIYVFSTIAAFGVCVMYNIWWMYVLIGLLIIVQFIRTRLEEKVLLNKFNNEYSEYKKATWF